MIEFLIKLVDNNQIKLLILTLILLTIVVLGVIAGLVFLIKFIVSKARLGVKIGDTEVNLNSTDKSKSSEKSESVPKKSDPVFTGSDNIQNFISVTTAIISYSIDNGHETSLKRQKLFDCQLSIIKNNFDTIQMLILTDYINKNKYENYELISLLLRQAFEAKIITPLEDICRADKLAEKTKDSIISLNRNFIDLAYNHLCFELQRIAKVLANGNDTSAILECVAKLLECVSNHQEAISKTIITTLERLHTEATQFLLEVQNCNISLNSKINTVLKAYFDNADVFKELPKSWIDSNSSLPPVEIVGSKGVKN